MSETINGSGNGTSNNRLSRRAGIREKCLNCTCWEHAQVKSCDFENDCSLHPFRMGTGRQNPEERGKAIKSHCLSCMCGDRKEVTLCPSTGCTLYPYRKRG
jgi:hypothetical protein